MQITIPCRLRWLAVPLLVTVAVVPFPVASDLQAQSAASQQQYANDKPYVIEYYYKAKWATPKNLSPFSRKPLPRPEKRKSSWAAS